MPETVIHPLAPIADENSRILILGTMPSPRSRAEGFYYAHPQNRFWRVLAAIYGEALPCTNAERTDFLLRHGIALWDVLQSCTITGAADSSIRQPVANDIAELLRQYPGITRICTTGKEAARLYRRYCLPHTHMEAIPLPSTSAANAACGLESLISSYRKVLL